MGARIDYVVPIGVGQEIAPWLEHQRARGLTLNGVAWEGIVLQRLAAVLFRDAGRLRLHDANEADLARWFLSGLPSSCGANTRSKHLTVVKGFYRWLEKTGRIFCNPARELRVPTVRRRLFPAIAVSKVVHVLRSVRGDDPVSLRDRAILEMAYGTGARRAELRNMNLSAVDLDRGTVRVLGKGARERVLPMTRAGMETVRRYLEEGRPALLLSRADTPALWISERTGRRLDISWFSVLVVRRSTAAGVPFNLHALRRACATHMLQGGASVTEVKMLLGHAGYSRLDHYLRCAAVELRAAHRRSRLSR